MREQELSRILVDRGADMIFGPAVNILIGHRGVGKTTVIRRLANLSPERARFLDLDQEIELATRKRIADLFVAGEAEFRRVESMVMNRLVNDARASFAADGRPTWIAAGAGVERVPDGAHVVWLRRSTDETGRVFLNRPRLNPEVSPYSEYMERFKVRDGRFKAWAHEEIWLPEGYEGGLEGFFFDHSHWHLPFDLTLLPENFRDWPTFWRRRRKWGLRRLEVRDDVLSAAQIRQVLEAVPAEMILFSARNSGGPAAGIGAAQLDWALELGDAPGSAGIVSLHERSGDLATAFTRLSRAGDNQIEKLSVEINSFSELLDGHTWWRERPAKRAFLPRSPDGRWRWYRTLFGPQMPLHFFREGQGSALDQPYLWEVLNVPVEKGRFAAVLGSPVGQSRSPVEHHGFFARHGIPFVAIDIHEREWSEAWPVLERLGLHFAAVTSPLKKAAGAVNTLWRERGGWRRANTDEVALREIAGDMQDFSKIWIWGAGAVSASVKVAFPNAKVISAREGTGDEDGPGLLIWATGRAREFKWPPIWARPELVFDLNYTDDSPGLEWAATHNLTYQSGLRMFKLQAEEQRRLWRGVLE